MLDTGYFESLAVNYDTELFKLVYSLVDYEPTANWGNWQYVAGVGNDPRASRQFNPIKQARDYDPHGDYVRTWIVQLSDIPAAKVHTPWLLSDAEWERHVFKAAGKIAQDHRESHLIPPSSVSDKRNRQVLSAEAVGRLGLADHTKSQRPLGKQNFYSSRNRGDADVPSPSRQSNNDWASSSRSSLSNAGSASTGDQNSGPLRHESYASESTGASSYSVSDSGEAGSDVAETRKPPVRPNSDRSRSSGTNASGSENGSAEPGSSNLSGGHANKLRNEQVTYKSAATINKGLKVRDDFVSEIPYPRTPLFEQDSWKPHYHRKDYGRKKAGTGTGGGNSRRLIRKPPPGKA